VRAGFSGADIANLVNEAALLAAKQGAEAISPALLDSSFDKIRMGVERKSCVRTPESMRRCGTD
jgi:ATP-dependent Zn protease